jgi:hypothetical protein
MNNLATQMAPPFALVAHYFIAGAFFYLITTIALPFFASELGTFFVSTKIASLMHLFLLGFVMMIIFGAMYQLIPVVLEIPLFSKDFAYVQFYTFLVGIVLFSLCLYFDAYLPYAAYGGMLIYLSMLIFIINVFLTYTKLQEFSIAAKYIFVSNIFLLIGISFGFFICLNLIYGFYDADMLPLIQAHILCSVGGYVIMTIFGIGIILLPMFSLSHGFSQKPIEWALYLLTIGICLYLVDLFISQVILFAFSSILIGIGVLLGMYQMWLIFSTRIRKQFDAWAKNIISSFGYFLLAVICLILFFITQNNDILMLFGFLIFFGFFVFFIIGHIYKILPFLVWFQRYSPLVGKIKVPMLHEMIKEDIATKQFFLTSIGTFFLAIGIAFAHQTLFIIGAVIAALGTILVLYNMYYSLTYGLKQLKGDT